MKTNLSQTSTDAARKRSKILSAAIHEFSERGLAGARTDSIANSAGVNKALLYYYFKSKNGLYTEALKEVGSKVMESAMAALDSGSSPGESLLRLVLNHFDRLLTEHEFQTLMQQEMVRYRRGESETIACLVQSVFEPLLKKMQQISREGIRTGELCAVDGLQIIYAAIGANVFYFLSAPMMRLLLSFDLFDPAHLRFRRKAAIEFLGSALFVDRRHGAKLAKHILTATPMPRLKKFSRGRSYT
jgi:TetR/AcrR family transcriptional regulator